jgi:ligand-binding sensor domain-containing protein
LFVATDDGVFERRNNNWQGLAMGGCPCGPRLSALATFRDELWVGGFDSGLCRFDGKHWHHYQGNSYLPSDMINHLATGRGRLYVATLKGLVIIDKRLHFSRFTRDQCVDNPGNNCPFYESVTGIASDQSTANVWIADTGSVHRFSSRKWRHFYRAKGITSEHITRIAADRSRIAVGTSDKGLLLFDNGKFFRILDDSTGLSDNWIMDLSFDRSGALWIATCTRGVSRYDNGTWRTWTTLDGLSDDYALTVSEIQGRIWIGHFRGISILSGYGIVNLSVKDGLAGNEVHAILEHRGKVYLATDGGLTILETT